MKFAVFEQIKKSLESVKRYALGEIGNVANATVEAVEEIAGELNQKADKPNYITVVILIEGWQSDDFDYPQYYDIAVEGITENDRTDIILAMESMKTAAECGFCNVTETLEGKIRVRAMAVPKEAITAEIRFNTNCDAINIEGVTMLELQNGLNQKADKTTVITELAKKLDKTDFTAENIGTMLEVAGWQSGGDMSEELQVKANKDLSNVEQSDFNNKFMVKGNIFIGNTATPLPLLTTGNGNIAIGIGDRILTAATTGYNNVAICYGALYYTKTAHDNIAIGQFALTKNQDGNSNVAIGQQASNTLKTGDFNTAVGYCALSGSTDCYNATAIGANANVTGDNQVQLGDTGVTVYAQKALVTRSDARDKLDIEDSPLGLNFILKLRPCKYRMNSREAYFKPGQKRDFSATNDGSKAGKRPHYGLIAQEVKEAMNELNVDFAGYLDSKVDGGEDVLSLGYTEFIAPMIKAIQEQQNMIEELQKQVDVLKQKINEVV